MLGCWCYKFTSCFLLWLRPTQIRWLEAEGAYTMCHNVHDAFQLSEPHYFSLSVHFISIVRYRILLAHQPKLSVLKTHRYETQLHKWLHLRLYFVWFVCHSDNRFPLYCVFRIGGNESVWCHLYRFMPFDNRVMEIEKKLNAFIWQILFLGHQALGFLYFVRVDIEVNSSLVTTQLGCFSSQKIYFYYCQYSSCSCIMEVVRTQNHNPCFRPLLSNLWCKMVFMKKRSRT